MWRVLLLASLFALLGLGTAAYAECTSCLTSAIVDRTASSGSNTTVSLSFTARADDDASLPMSVSAVVMQVDGQRTKCLSVTLPKASGFPGGAVYSGTFSAYGVVSHSGRVDLAGQIYEFTVPLDGKPGTIALATDQTPLGGRGFAVQVTAAPVTPQPLAVYLADAAAPAPGTAQTGPQLPAIDPTFLIGGAVILVTIVGAYVDRRRALARSLAA
ncbi:MAG: hypothetical protein ACRDG6_09485 [Candidatus Limnocylindria bacterium]